MPDAAVVPSQDRLFATQAMAVQGPMARRVADVRLGLRIISGAHPRDPWSLEAPFEGPRPAGRLRVAVLDDPPGGETDPVVRSAVRAAAAALSDAGYDVVQACPPAYEEALEVWARLLLGDFALMLPQFHAVMGEGGRAFLDAVNAAYPPLSHPGELSQILIRRDSIARSWSQFMADHPLLLTPTWAQLPFEHGFDIASPQASMEVVALMRPVLPANLLGLPSACVPAGRDPGTGLPIGVLVNGRRLRDDLCLDAAEAIEARLPLATPIDPAW